MTLSRFFKFFIFLFSLTNFAFSQTPQPFIIGVGTHMGQKLLTSGQAKPLMNAAGSNSFRDEIFWGRIEENKGVLTFPDRYRDMDSLVTTLNKEGGKPIIVLVYGNKFYDDNDGVESDEAIQAFTKYAKFVAQHFKGRVTLFEVWNEWNIGLGSTKKPRTTKSVDTYVKLLDSVYKAIKKEVPEAVVIGGSVAGPDDKWIDKFIALGGLKKADAFSVHPYFYDRTGRTRPEDAIDWLKDLNSKILKANNNQSVPLYLTELGWPNDNVRRLLRRRWEPEQTADFLIRFYLQAKSLNYVAGAWWYELVNTGTDSDNKEHNFGMAEKSLKPKPALQAMAVVSKIINQATSLNVSTARNGLYKASIQTAKNGKCIALWTKDHSLTVDFAGESTYKQVLWGVFDHANGRLRITETPLIMCEQNL